MSARSHFKAGLALTLGSALIVAACSESPARPGQSPIPSTGTTGVARQPDFNQLEVCKVYSGIVGAAVTISVTVDVADNGTIDLTLASLTLANGQCAEIPHSAPVDAPRGDRIFVTETNLAAGFTPTWTKLQTGGATASGTGATANAAVHFDAGFLITFTNTSIPTVVGEGRFTGGSTTELASGLTIHNGLTIHCDLLLSNNLQINWKDANDVQHQFHMTEHLTTVACTDSASIPQPPPAAPLDTLIGTGTGRFDGTPGYTVEFTLVDSGEPGGREDRIALRIFLGSSVVLNVPLQDITKGNLQAHFDQPHR